jgi:hypothetical protein
VGLGLPYLRWEWPRAEAIQVTDEEVDVATKALHAMLDFIETQLSRRVKREQRGSIRTGAHMPHNRGI